MAFISFIVGLPLMIIATSIVSILVEWVLIYSCDDGRSSMPTMCVISGFEVGMGEGHSKMMLNKEAMHLNSAFKESIIGSSPVIAIGEIIRWMDKNILEPVGYDKYKTRNLRNQTATWKYAVASVNIFKVVVLRVCVLLFSLPAYLLFGVVGVTCGLVWRDLRRFGASLESVDRFHLSLSLLKPSVVLCFVVYLSWPNAVSPALIVVPFAALFGYALFLVSSNYKKYL
nr:DUF4400 domain-containing protein [Shewanella algae]